MDETSPIVQWGDQQKACLPFGPPLDARRLFVHLVLCVRADFGEVEGNLRFAETTELEKGDSQKFAETVNFWVGVAVSPPFFPALDAGR